MEYDSDLVILKNVQSSGSKVKKPSNNNSIHVSRYSLLAIIFPFGVFV